MPIGISEGRHIHKEDGHHVFAQHAIDDARSNIFIHSVCQASKCTAGEVLVDCIPSWIADINHLPSTILVTEEQVQALATQHPSVIHWFPNL